MRTVYKYVIPFGGWQPLEMPVDAAVVSVAAQGERICIWAIVLSDIPSETRNYAISGTGHPAPEGGVYVGTAHSGGFVWHVWEAKR